MKKRTKERLEPIFRSCLESTTGHAIPNYLNTKYLSVKIIWGIAWLIGVAFTLYLIISNIIEYFQYNVVSQARLVNEIPMVFPKITICNKDPFITNASITFLADVIRSDSSYTSEVSSSGATNDLELVNYFLLNTGNFDAKALFEAQKTNLSTKMSLGYDMNTLIQSCFFEDVPCDASYFEYHYNLKFGNCFTFNPNKEKALKVYGAGKLNGLQLELFVGKDDSYETIASDLGATIFIYNHSTLYSEEEGIDVSVGFETNIALTKKITESLVKPYSNCEIDGGSSVDLSSTTDTQYVDLFNSLNLKYRENDCYIHCYLDVILEKCGCLDHVHLFHNLKNITIPSFCDWQQGSSNYNCMVQIMKQNDGEELYENCYAKCPLECDTVTNRYMTSFSNYPTLTALKFLASSSTELAALYAAGENIQLKVLKVNIYYDVLKYNLLNETPAISVVSLLGGLGGTLGLFLGFSVLSSCEAIELIINIIMEFRKTDSKVYPLTKN